MNKLAVLLVSFAPLFTSVASAAESRVVATSGWMKVASPGDATNPNLRLNATPNATYLSVQLLSSVLNVQDGWWTRFVKSNDKVGLVATVTAEGSPPQAVLSKFETVLNRDNFQFSTNKVLIREQPLGRKQISLELSLLATSEDGVAKMMTELGTALPAAGIATDAAITAGLGVVKSLVDALAGKDLLKTSLKSEYAMGDIESGVYAIFAAEKTSAYNSISGSDVKWENGKLVKKDGTALPSTFSYLVLRVSHLTRRYPDKDSVLNEPDADWANVYQQINKAISPITLGLPTKEKIATALAELQKQDAQLTELARKANILIQLDRTLTPKEKAEISEQGGMMLEYFSNRLIAQQVKLQSEIEAFATTATTAPAKKAAADALPTLKNLRDKIDTHKALGRW